MLSISGYLDPRFRRRYASGARVAKCSQHHHKHRVTLWWVYLGCNPRFAWHCTDHANFFSRGDAAPRRTSWVWDERSGRRRSCEYTKGSKPLDGCFRCTGLEIFGGKEVSRSCGLGNNSQSMTCRNFTRPVAYHGFTVTGLGAPAARNENCGKGDPPSHRITLDRWDIDVLTTDLLAITTMGHVVLPHCAH